MTTAIDSMRELFKIELEIQETKNFVIHPYVTKVSPIIESIIDERIKEIFIERIKVAFQTSSPDAQQNLFLNLLNEVRRYFSDNYFEEEFISISQFKKQAFESTELIKEEVKSIKQIMDQLSKDRDALLRQQETFNEFKKNLEIGSKSISFAKNANKNNIFAYIFQILFWVLLAYLLYKLETILKSPDSFSELALGVQDKLSAKNINNSIIANTIYFAYYKSIAIRILYFSLWIYGIVACYKSFNKNMHNHVIEMHKANSLRSLLNLLDTAKTDEGKDKIITLGLTAIFSHQETGYAGKDTELHSPGLVNNIIDSIKS